MRLTYDVACLACGEKIQKGEDVIVISHIVPGAVTTSYRHPSCRDSPAMYDISVFEGLR